MFFHSSNVLWPPTGGLPKGQFSVRQRTQSNRFDFQSEVCRMHNVKVVKATGVSSVEAGPSTPGTDAGSPPTNAMILQGQPWLPSTYCTVAGIVVFLHLAKLLGKCSWGETSCLYSLNAYIRSMHLQHKLLMGVWRCRMGAEVKHSLSLQKAESACVIYCNLTCGKVKACRGATTELKFLLNEL